MSKKTKLLALLAVVLAAALGVKACSMSGADKETVRPAADKPAKTAAVAQVAESTDDLAMLLADENMTRLPKRVNATPDSETIKVLLYDWTLLSGTPLTYSTEHPSKCIDYIFVRKDSKPVEVLSKRVITDGTATLSDHFPVAVTVRF